MWRFKNQKTNLLLSTQLYNCESKLPVNDDNDDDDDDDDDDEVCCVVF